MPILKPSASEGSPKDEVEISKVEENNELEIIRAQFDKIEKNLIDGIKGEFPSSWVILPGGESYDEKNMSYIPRILFEQDGTRKNRLLDKITRTYLDDKSENKEYFLERAKGLFTCPLSGKIFERPIVLANGITYDSSILGLSKEELKSLFDKPSFFYAAPFEIFFADIEKAKKEPKKYVDCRVKGILGIIGKYLSIKLEQEEKAELEQENKSQTNYVFSKIDYALIAEYIPSSSVLPAPLSKILNDIKVIDIDTILKKHGPAAIYSVKKLFAFIKDKIESFSKQKDPVLLRRELMNGNFESICVHLGIEYPNTVLLLEKLPISEIKDSFFVNHGRWLSVAFNEILTDLVTDKCGTQSQYYLLAYKADLMASLDSINELLKAIGLKYFLFGNPPEVKLLKKMQEILKEIEKNISENCFASIDSFVAQTQPDVLVEQFGASNLSESAKTILLDIKKTMDCLKLHDDWLNVRAAATKSTKGGFIEYLKRLSSSNNNAETVKASYGVSGQPLSIKRNFL